MHRIRARALTVFFACAVAALAGCEGGRLDAARDSFVGNEPPAPRPVPSVPAAQPKRAPNADLPPVASGSLVDGEFEVHKRAAENANGVAVIIGNRAYAGGVPPVDYAHNDAAAVRRFVTQVLGFRDGNIIDLRDASKAEMEAAFGSERSHKGRVFQFIRAGESDVVIYYSGHGAPGREDRRGYLLPVDADPNVPEVNGYPIDLLYSNLGKLDARSVTVFIDACFSGSSPKGMLIGQASPVAIVPKLPQAAADLTVLTAAREDQLASWDTGARHGLFTAHLLRALYGRADTAPFGDGDGKVEVSEVRAYLDREMTYAARRQFNRDQSATVLANEDPVLVSYDPDNLPRPAAAKPRAATPPPAAASSPEPPAAPPRRSRRFR